MGESKILSFEENHPLSFRGRKAEPGTQSRELSGLGPRFALRAGEEDGHGKEKL